MDQYAGQAASAGQYRDSSAPARPETQLESIYSRLMVVDERLGYAVKRLHGAADTVMGQQPPRVEKDGGLLGASNQAQPSHLVFRINDVLSRIARSAENINDAATRFESL